MSWNEVRSLLYDTKSYVRMLVRQQGRPLLQTLRECYVLVRVYIGDPCRNTKYMCISDKIICKVLAPCNPGKAQIVKK
jgi:hypothetical protein